MKIERGEHMSYPPKFEDIEAWQFARELTSQGQRNKGNPEPVNAYLTFKRKGAHSSRIVKQAGSLGELVRRTYDI